MDCVFCGSSQPHERFMLRERMFGLPGEFAYLLCSGCGAMRIESVPDHLADYYPEDYYSFDEPWVLSYSAGLKWRVLRLRDRYEWTGKGFLGRLLARAKPNPRPRHLWGLQLRPSERVLDVGCGSGQNLRTLRSVGFSKLCGVDPFIAADIREDGLTIRKSELSEMDGPYDAIMIHHALEHMADHVDVLRTCRRLLAPSGRLLVRVPTISCEAWSRYGVDWFQLDAPRHLVLHSRKSMELLAKRAGFEVVSVVDDSSANQFVISELYRLGLPLVPRDEVTRARKEEAMAKMPVGEFREETERLNREGRGDQISVLLRPS